MRQGQRDGSDAVLREYGRGSRAQDRPGRAVGVARDRKIPGLDLSQRGFAREQLDAGLLGREACGKARGASGALAAVVELLRGEESVQVFGRGFGEQALDARDLDRIDTATGG